MAVTRFPAVSATGDRKVVEIQPQRVAPAPSSVVPLIYAGIGIALGISTALAISLSTMPIGRLMASNDSKQTTPTWSESERAPAPQPSVQQASPTKEAVRAVSKISQPPAHLVLAARTTVSTKAQSTRRKSWSALKHGALQRVARPIRPARPAPETNLAHLVTPQLVTPQFTHVSYVIRGPTDSDSSPGNRVASSSFYVEGDLQIVDHNPDTGTIQTSDGRTFVVDKTNGGTNLSWQEGSTDVHYRCGSQGSCVLLGLSSRPLSATVI